ncbi:MAG: OadG family protein [Desulfobacteraceae bacterium]|nr:OadG family protein [Desulfobacteraceae bacterium]
MKGVEAILHYDGFTMAVLGILTVFAALLVLAVIISQLHNAVTLWENKKLYLGKLRRLFSPPEEPEPMPEVQYFDDLNESARQFKLLINNMGEPFSLPELIQKAETVGIAHAHSTISHLIVSNLIVPDKNGYYRLNHEAYKRLS